ncbi:MAG: glycosyltransferase family 39 protein [Actinomycetota bacterium]|nr:glycosyltransferase family 39 protein [Actinomycetota bacterium]
MLWPGRLARLTPLALPALLGLAAANFLWQLGSSSYFVDEVQSLTVADSSLGGVLHAVGTIELTPPAYFYFLHEWLLRTGSHAEWVARLPSVLCGVALVGAVHWLALALSERRGVALAAGALAALSPFVLQYAQLSEGYVFVMLAVTLAVAAAIQGERTAEHRAERVSEHRAERVSERQAERTTGRPGLWLAGAALASVLSLWLHYTAVLVIVPLCAWVASRCRFTVRSRVAFTAACAVAGLALVPLLVTQHETTPIRSGVATSAGLTAANVERLFETPFDGRLDALAPLGVLVTAGAMLVLIAAGRNAIAGQRLVLSVAVGGPLVLLALSAVGGQLMLARYAAVTVPFTIVGIAAAGAALARIALPVAGLLGAAAAAAAIAGLLDSHRPQSFYPDARGVVAYVQSRELAGGQDAVLAPSNPAIEVPLIYYGVQRLHVHWTAEASTARLVAQRSRRLWTILELTTGAPSAKMLIRVETPGARLLGYRVLAARVFPGAEPLAVLLLAPSARSRSLDGRT